MTSFVEEQKHQKKLIVTLRCATNLTTEKCETKEGTHGKKSEFITWWQTEESVFLLWNDDLLSISAEVLLQQLPVDFQST